MTRRGATCRANRGDTTCESHLNRQGCVVRQWPRAPIGRMVSSARRLRPSAREVRFARNVNRWPNPPRPDDFLVHQEALRRLAAHDSESVDDSSKRPAFERWVEAGTSVFRLDHPRALVPDSEPCFVQRRRGVRLRGRGRLQAMMVTAFLVCSICGLLQAPPQHQARAASDVCWAR